MTHLNLLRPRLRPCEICGKSTHTGFCPRCLSWLKNIRTWCHRRLLGHPTEPTLPLAS